MSRPHGKKFQGPNTHYWCEFCDKFIKNTSIDRKSHENGSLHQEAKRKKIDALRSGSEETKLLAQIAELENAASKSSAIDGARASTYGSEFSTYTPSYSTPSSAPTSAVKPPTTTVAKAAPPTPSPTRKDEPIVEQKAKEAALPGMWQEVTEEANDNPYHEIDEEAEAKQKTANPKKRERYGEDEDALEQMEAESRIMTSTKPTERVPEVYRPSAVGVASEEPVFKAKVAKGANVKKRTKQL